MRKTVEELREQLERYIASDPSDEGDYDAGADIWEILGLMSYNGQVDEDFIYVIEAMLESVDAGFTTSIAERTGWPPEYPELIKYILCSCGLAEYGTSPRGAWIDHSLQRIMPKVLERWRKQLDFVPA